MQKARCFEARLTPVTPGSLAHLYLTAPAGCSLERHSYSGNVTLAR